MKMNDLFRGVLLIAAIASCSNEPASLCGVGEEVSVDGESYCVYRSAVVVENGFQCPPEVPNLMQEGAIGVCSGEQMIPGGTLERIGREYRERQPGFEGCILDHECAAGETCRTSGCTPTNTTNNVTNNTTGTTNNTTNSGTCATSADCELGFQCENGVCAAVCGGFAGFVCAANEWCDYPDGSNCGAADMLGFCRPRPEACIELFDPVCGCDSADYSNECDAQAAGVDVLSAGMCP